MSRTPNLCLQLSSAYPARPRRLRGLQPQSGFGREKCAVTRTTDTVALAAEPQGR
jgi:hypothetical protein